MRKTSLLLLALAVSLLVSGCDADRYDEGYTAGYESGLSQGMTQGQEEGYGNGLAEGYDQGYAAGYAGRSPDASLSDTRTVGAIRTSLRVFTTVFYWLIVLGLLAVIAYLFLLRSSNPGYLAAKVLFILMSVAIGYVAVSASNLSGILDPPISDAQRWVVIVALGILTFLACSALRALLILYDKVYSDITALFVTTSVLVFFSFLLINIDVFVLSNWFASYCVMAVSAGGLAFGGYAIIAETRNG